MSSRWQSAPLWQTLKAATGDVRLGDPRFATPQLRHQHRVELNAILADIFASKTRAEIQTMAPAKKLPLGPVWTPAEVRDDPHMVARAYFQSVIIDGREFSMPSIPVKWNRRAFPQVVAAARHNTI